MKTSFTYTTSIFFLLLLLLTSCGKELEDLNYGADAETSENVANNHLRVGESSILIPGDMPGDENGGIQLNQFPSVVQVSAGITLFYTFNSNRNEDLCQLYLQIEGSDSYWKSPIQRIQGTPYVAVFIPNNVQNGEFNILFSVEDCNGNISRINSVNTQVAEPLACGQSFEGSYGITALNAYIQTQGIVTINYEFYSIPDRMDVRYNDAWVASTGSLLQPNQIPSCTVFQNGVVSGSGSLSFDVNPNVSNFFQVYVSGCDVDTAWIVDIICP
jgi:hypothetical protein